MTTAAPSDPTRRFQQFNAIAKTVSLMAVAIGALITSGIFLASYRDVPARTEQNRVRIEQLYSKFDVLTNAVRELKKGQDLTNCLTLAERRHEDWRACITPAPGALP